MSKLFKYISPVAFLISLSAQAGVSPLGLSIVPPIELPPSSFTVTGARLSVLWGEHVNMYGIDLGAIGNVTDQSFVGIAVAGGFNYNKGTATVIGLQAAGIANVNVNKANIYGLQVALANINEAESVIGGVELGLINNSSYTHVVGVQAGLYNSARTMTGFQIGLVNVAENLQGIQIGLANFNHTGLFSFAPFLNIGF